MSTPDIGLDVADRAGSSGPCNRAAAEPWRLFVDPASAAFGHGAIADVEIGLPETERGPSIAALAALAARAKAFDLSLGDHASAVRCVEFALEA